MSVSYVDLLEKSLFSNINIQVIKPVKSKETITLACHKCFLYQSNVLTKSLQSGKILEKEMVNLETLKFIISFLYGKDVKVESKKVDLNVVLKYAQKWNLKELFLFVAGIGSKKLTPEESAFIGDYKSQGSPSAILKKHIETKLFEEFKKSSKQTTSFVLYAQNGKKFHVHRELLYIKSTFFRSKIDEMMKNNEDDSSSLVVNELSPSALYLLVNYFYMGNVPGELLNSKVDVNGIITFDYTTFLQLYRFASDKLKINDLVQKVLPVLNKAIHKGNAIECYMNCHDYFLDPKSPLKKIIFKHLLGLFGSNKDSVKQFTETISTKMQKFNILEWPEKSSLDVTLFGKELEWMNLLKRKLFIQQSRIDNSLKVVREKLEGEKNGLSNRGEDIEKEIQTLMQRNQINQERIQKLGSIDKKKALLNQQEKELVELKKEEGKNLKKIIDLEDSISQLKGDIFVWKEKHDRYYKDLQKTEETLIGNFEKKESLRIERELLIDREEQNDKMRTQYNIIRKKDLGEYKLDIEKDLKDRAPKVTPKVAPKVPQSKKSVTDEESKEQKVEKKMAKTGAVKLLPEGAQKKKPAKPTKPKKK